MATGAYLVIDQGGHGSRAVVYDASGAALAAASRAVDTRRSPNGYVEQDTAAIVESVRAAVDEVRKTLRAGAVAGLACQRSSVLCWRRSTGAPLTPVLSWQDTRAAAMFDSLSLDAARVRRITGLPPSPHYGATKLAWCIEHDDAVADALLDGDLCVGPLASFLVFHLAVERPFITTPTLAQRTLLFDVGTGLWSPELLDAFGLPDAILPAVTPDRSWSGTLDGGIPLQLVVGDQNAVPFAFGPLPAGTAVINAGTGAFVLARVGTSADVPDGLLASLLPDGTFAAEGTVNGAGAAVTWFERRHRTPFPWQDLDAGNVAPADAPLFVNAIGDLGSPFWRTGVEPRFEPSAFSHAAESYAVLESIAFLIRANVERMGTVDRLIIGGGLSRSDAFCRVVASATGCTVERSEDAELTARGVLALLGGAATAVDRSGFAPCTQADLDGRYTRWSRLMV